jgi:hypothetical protein
MLSLFVLFLIFLLNFLIMVYVFKWSAQLAYGIKASTGQALFQWIIFIIIQIGIAFLFFILASFFSSL